MVSDDQEERSISIALPADVRDWLEDEADRRDVPREQFCRQLLTAVRTVEADDSLAPLEPTSETETVGHWGAAERESLRDAIADQREEFIDHVEDVRRRVVELKRELDRKAPADHGHEAYASTAAVTDLEADVEALEDSVDAGFENFESILEHLLETAEELERRSTTLATAVIDLRDRRDALAARERRRAETDRLKLAANRLGIQNARCESCSTAVTVALLTEPACPHCDATYADVAEKASFFGSHTLETGEPPALQPATEAAVDTGDDGSVFEAVKTNASSKPESDAATGERTSEGQDGNAPPTGDRGGDLRE